jgi:hypothetical protein
MKTDAVFIRPANRITVGGVNPLTKTVLSLTGFSQQSHHRFHLFAIKGVPAFL